MGGATFLSYKAGLFLSINLDKSNKILSVENKKYICYNSRRQEMRLYPGDTQK